MNKYTFCISLVWLFITWGCIPENRESERFDQFLDNLTDASINDRHDIVEEFLSSVEQTPLIEGKELVHFFLYENADTVKIHGDLQKGWSVPEQLSKIESGNKDFFYISYKIPSNSQLEYQFIVDGEARLDFMNRKIVSNFEFGDRNVFQMPDFLGSPYINYRVSSKKGRIVFQNLRSLDELFMDRKLEIYLPPDYHEEKTYPVLLVNDGKYKLYQTPFKNVIDNLIDENAIVPIIVVFIPTIERDKEYCQEAALYAKYIVKEIVPVIKSNYSTESNAEKWGIMGSSMGGHISMATGFLYPEIISNVGAQGGAGGAISWCGLEKLMIAYSSTKENYPLTNIFASVGTYDLELAGYDYSFLDGARNFKIKLDSLGIKHQYYEYNNGHSDSNWNNTIDDILVMFYGI